MNLESPQNIFNEDIFNVERFINTQTFFLTNYDQDFCYLYVFFGQLASVGGPEAGVLRIRLLRERGVGGPDLRGHKLARPILRGQACLLVLAVALHHQVELKEKRPCFISYS